MAAWDRIIVTSPKSGNGKSETLSNVNTAGRGYTVCTVLDFHVQYVDLLRPFARASPFSLR